MGFAGLRPRPAIFLCAARALVFYFTTALYGTAGARFQTDNVMVGTVLIAAAGVALTQLLLRIEKRFERWRPVIGG